MESFKTRSLADSRPATAELRTSAPPEPAKNAPPAPSHLTQERTAPPPKQKAPLVRFEMFSSLAEIQSFLADCADGTPGQRGQVGGDGNGQSAQIIVMVLRTEVQQPTH